MGHNIQYIHDTFNTLHHDNETNNNIQNSMLAFITAVFNYSKTFDITNNKLDIKGDCSPQIESHIHQYISESNYDETYFSPSYDVAKSILSDIISLIKEPEKFNKASIGSVIDFEINNEKLPMLKDTKNVPFTMFLIKLQLVNIIVSLLEKNRGTIANKTYKFNETRCIHSFKKRLSELSHSELERLKKINKSSFTPDRSVESNPTSSGYEMATDVEEVDVEDVNRQYLNAVSTEGTSEKNLKGLEEKVNANAAEVNRRHEENKKKISEFVEGGRKQTRRRRMKRRFTQKKRKSMRRKSMRGKTKRKHNI